MALTSNIKDRDWVSVRQAAAKLGSIKLGPTSTPTFLGVTTTSLTISGLTTNSLIYPVAGLLTSLGVATNGQLPIGSTGVAPVLAEITGTTNRITSTPGAGSITLSTPQDIHTGASNFTVAGLTVTNATVMSSDSVVFQPNTDSTTFLQVLAADDTPVLSIDTTNERAGIGRTAFVATFEVEGNLGLVTSGAAIAAETENGLIWNNATSQWFLYQPAASSDLRLKTSASDNFIFKLDGNFQTALNGGLEFGSTSDTLRVSDTYKQMGFAVNKTTASGGQLILGAWTIQGRDYGHAPPTDPTFFGHSATDPTSQSDEWWSATHDKTDAVFSLGKGAYNFTHAVADTDLEFNFIGTTNSGKFTWMEDEDYFKFDDDIKFALTGRLNWTKITANNITQGNGTHSGTTGDTSGLVGDIQTAHDGNFYHIDEVASDPGFELTIEFTGVTAFNWVNILASYDGSASHSNQIALYNFNTTTWDGFDSIPTTQAEVATAGEYSLGNHDFFVADDTNYIGTGGDDGDVRVRLRHTMTGNAAHDLDLDVVAIYQ